MKITWAFDGQGGFYAKSESDKGVTIQYAYPTSEWATKATKRPQLIAECMVGDEYDLVYSSQPPETVQQAMVTIAPSWASPSRDLPTVKKYKDWNAFHNSDSWHKEMEAA